MKVNVFSLKGNHGNLHEDVKLFLESSANPSSKEIDFYEKVDGDYGKIETRRCYESI